MKIVASLVYGLCPSLQFQHVRIVKLKSYCQKFVCILLFINLCFLTVNRRLDEWVKLEQLDLNSVETVVDEKVEDKV